MADAKVNPQGSRTRPMVQRPLSPHLSIFRPYITMVMSIVHRITGTANYFGSLLLALWLISAAASDAAFDTMSGLLASPLGLVVLFGFTWSLMHHMLGGIRHFIWDTGRGFSLGSARALAWGTLLLSITLTGLIWMVTLAQWGTR